MDLLRRFRFDWLARLLLVGLLWVQMLGLVHSLTHGPERHFNRASDPSTATFALKPGSAADSGKGQGASWLASLFQTHKDDADCLLFDQASHGSAAPGVASQSLPTVLAAQVFEIFRGEALIRMAAPYSARAPPFTR